MNSCVLFCLVAVLVLACVEAHHHCTPQCGANECCNGEGECQSLPGDGEECRPGARPRSCKRCAEGFQCINKLCTTGEAESRLGPEAARQETAQTTTKSSGEPGMPGIPGIDGLPGIDGFPGFSGF